MPSNLVDSYLSQLTKEIIEQYIGTLLWDLVFDTIRIVSDRISPKESRGHSTAGAGWDKAN